MTDIGLILSALRETQNSLETLGEDGWSEAPHLLRLVRAAIYEIINTWEPPTGAPQDDPDFAGFADNH